MPWSGVNTLYSTHWVQHTLSTTYTAYCIIPRSTDSRSQPVSQLSADRNVLNSLHSHNYELTNEWSLSLNRTHLPSYRLQIVCLQIVRLQIFCLQIECCPIDCLHTDYLQINRLEELLQWWSIMASKCNSQHAPLWLPSASLSSLNLALLVHLQTHWIMISKCLSEFTQISASKCICEFTWPLSLRVHLDTRSITRLKCISGLAGSQPLNASLTSVDLSVSKCISKLTQHLPPSASLCLLDRTLQVHPQTQSIKASFIILKEEWRVYGHAEVTEVDRLSGSIYSADPAVDRHHLISISSYHTMNIHTLFFPTFGLTCSVQDFVDSQ